MAVIGCGSIGLNAVQGGTAVLIGVYPDGASIEFPAGRFLEERKVIGCDLGSNRFPIDMPRLVDMYGDGRLDLDSLLPRRISLEEINDGSDAMRADDVIRTIIDFGP